MKCSFCGNELENGAQFCPGCGMIISLGEDGDNNEKDNVVESVYNVFKGNTDKENQGTVKKETAKELEIDPSEEKVEFVMSIPEFEEYDAEPIKTPETLEIPDNSAEAKEEAVADEDTAEEEMEDIYSYSSEDMKEPEEKLDIRVPEMDVIYEGPEKAPEAIAVPEVSPKNEKLRQQKQAKENLKKISPDKKENKKAPKTEKSKKEPPKAEPAKKKGIDGIKIEGVLGIAIAVVVLLIGCVYAIKNDKIPVLGELFADDNKPEFVGENGEEVYTDVNGNYYYCDDDGVSYPYIALIPPTEEDEEDTTETTTEEDTTESTTETTTGEDTTESTTQTTAESTTETTTETTTKETTTETTTKETTTKETTTKESTTKETTTKPTTTKPITTTKPVTTTKPATTKPVTTTKPAATTKPSTTKPATTKPVVPSTTKPVVTTKPATTKPATTKPSTTKDPYGINDVTVKKPASYLAKSYTAYVTAEGLNLRSKPTTDSERVLFLSKGADVVVLAKENGFCYIKSNRYGVYGWVSANYLAASRPQSESVVQSGTVTPDQKYATAEIKYTINGLNVRKGPGTNYAVVGLVPISYPVKVIGYKSGVSGWVYVQDTTYGYTGWVSTAYLK